MPRTTLLSPVRFSALLLSVATFASAGCGVDNAPTSGVTNVIALPQGLVHGGPNPVTGATVTLYSTVTNGSSTYGSAGTVLATAMTDGNGSFTFTSRSACPSTGVNEQAYITSTGGNPGGPPGTTNPNYVLMAALGNCSDLTTDTRIWVDEPSTIAAAYALSAFTTTTTNPDGSVLVHVGAPLNAAAAAGACTNTTATASSVTTTTVTSCVTAGLRHAFQNAANLVNAVGTTAAPPNGQAYASAPSAAGSIAPQAVMHSLGNALQSCVNSTGVAGGSGSACGRLFADTTPSGGAAPTNTIDALVNLAKNPTLGAADIYSLATPQIFYSPSLTAAPTDFTLAIVYPATSTGLSATSTSYISGFADGLALDSNDNVYLTFEVGLSSGAGATLNSVAALSSNGTLLYGAGSDTIPNERAPFNVATDSLGNVWTTVYTTSSNTADFRVFQYDAATGANVQTYSGFPKAPVRAAVDRQNNVWFTARGGGSNYQNVQELVQSNNYTPATFTMPPIGQGSGAVGIAIDAGQNIWATSLTNQEVFPNTGSSSSPAYGGAVIQAGSFSGYLPYSAIDSEGNLWAGTGFGVVTFTPTLSAGKVTAITSGTTLPPNDFEMGIAADGGGAVWVSDLGAGNLARYTASSATGLALNPCLVAAGSTTCGPAFNPNAIAVDSAGSVWVATGSGIYDQSSSGLLQVIGSATPVWPQLSYGHPGQEPQ